MINENSNADGLIFNAGMRVDLFFQLTYLQCWSA
jgi:hypothetical protein